MVPPWAVESPIRAAGWPPITTFMLPGGAFTDIVAVSHNGFIVGTGEDFLAFLTAVAHTTPQSPHPNPVEQFLQAHPRALKFVQDAQPLPVSFATLSLRSAQVNGER